MISSSLASYGYAGIFIGTVIGGELILLPAAYFSSLGYLALPWVILIAALGSFLGDQIYFWSSRYGYKAIVKRYSKLKNRVESWRAKIEPWQDLVTLSFRFYFGLRIVTLLALGASRMKSGRFLALNLIGALLWSVSFGLLGYFFGAVAVRYAMEFKTQAVTGGVLILMLLIVQYLFRRYFFDRL